MENKGILIVVSGFSGAGKGTIMRALLDKYEETYALSVSATTRDPRPGEVEGREYFFRTVEEFEKMIAKEDLIEYAKYVDNYYGTPRTYVEEQLERLNLLLAERNRRSRRISCSCRRSCSCFSSKSSSSR